MNVIPFLRAAVFAVCGAVVTGALSSPNGFCVFVPSAADPDDLSVSLWHAGVSTTLRPRAERAADGTFLALDVPCAAGSVVVIESPVEIGIAAPDSDCRATTPVAVAKKADIVARFVTLAGGTLPTWGTSRLRCGGTAIEIPFAIHGSRVRMSVPATCADLSFRVGTYAPVMPPPVKWIVGETNDLGTLALRRGASAAEEKVIGTVELRLPATRLSTPVNLVIRTWDGRLSCATLRLDHDATVIVPSQVGDVRLVGRLPAGSQTWLLSSTGCAVPLFGIREEKNGEAAGIVQKLPAGRWALVQPRSGEERAALFSGRGAILAPLATLTVEPGRTTHLTVP